MTTNLNDITKRKTILGTGQEESRGIPRSGFVDPTGEFPNEEYYFSNNVNKAAKGETTNRVYTGGGDYNVSVEVSEQIPSRYPYNQVTETPSGHSIEIDDTPGGERVLIKHRTGAGIEFRSDGSVLFSSRNKKVEVSGGDDVVIVEGEATLVYKGNVNVKVSGDYNLEVEGNINVTTAGNKVETIHRNHKVVIDENQNTTVKGSRGKKVVGVNTETLLSDNFSYVKGNQENEVKGDIKFNSGAKLITTAVEEWVATSKITSLAGDTISAIGVTGTIGGHQVDHYGKTFGGPPGGAGNGGTTHYGTLIGKATEAITSDYANRAGTAKQADAAKSAPNGSPGSPGKYETKMPYEQIPQTGPMPTTPLVNSHISSGTYGIVNVQVDPEDKLLNEIIKTDDYDNLINRDPTIHEIRSKLRDPANLNNSTFTGNLVASGKLNSKFKNTPPKKFKRISGVKNVTKFGSRQLGNAPHEKRSKRFKL